jgi:hypothetical protein
MDKVLTPKVKAMLASWARSFIAATVALYSAGETDPSVLLNAGIAAVVPVIIRYVNKKDAAFGLVAKKVLETAQAEVVKKTTKKTAAKKAK